MARGDDRLSGRALVIGLLRRRVLYKLHDLTNGAVENSAKDLNCVGADAFISLQPCKLPGADVIVLD